MTTSTPDLNTIIERLEKVEQNYLRLIWVISFVGLFLGLAVFRLSLGMSNRIVEAQGFVVKDASGNTRARLGFSEKDALFDLYDANGNPQVGLTATPYGPLVSLYDKSGKPSGALGAGETGSYLLLYDAETKQPGAKLAVTKKESLLSLYDASGQARIVLEHTKKMEQTGSVKKESESSLILYDRDGNVLFTVP